jgi:hypothetical protein
MASPGTIFVIVGLACVEVNTQRSLSPAGRDIAINE